MLIFIDPKMENYEGRKLSWACKINGANTFPIEIVLSLVLYDCDNFFQ